MKPLFFPLKTEWFRAFERGEKSIEYRAYGARWNESNCIPGREATLSHGYSGARIKARVETFKRIALAEAPPEARALFRNHTYIAAIVLQVN